MTAPVTGIALTIETSGVARGRDEWVHAQQRIMAETRATKAEMERLRAEVARQGQVYANLDHVMASTAESLGTVSAGTVGWSRSLVQLRAPLASLTAQATGLTGPLSSVANVLAGFAVGSPLAAGVVAGLGAIALAWRAMHRESQEAKDELEKIREEAERLIARANEASGKTLDVRIDIVHALFEKAGAEEAALIKQAEQELNSFFRRIEPDTKRRLEEASARRADYQRQEEAFLAEKDRREQEAADRRRQEETALARERKRNHDEEMRQIAARQKAINDGLARYREFLQGASSTVASVISSRGVVSSIDVGADRSTVALAKFQAALEQLAQPVTLNTDAAGRLARAIDTVTEGEDRRQERIQRAVEQGQAEKQAALDAADAARQLTETLFDLPTGLADVTAGLVGLGQSLIRVNSQTGKLELGLTSPAGLISAGAQILGGLLSGDGGAAERAFADAVRSFERSVADFQMGTKDAYTSAQRTLEDTFDQLVRQAASLYGIGTAGRDPSAIAAAARAQLGRPRGREEASDFLREFDRLSEILAERTAELNAQRERDLALVGQEFEVRRLSALGLTDEAQALRNQLDIRRELADLEERFGPALDEATKGEYERILVLEQEAEAARQAADAAQRLADVLAGLTDRELNARLRLAAGTGGERGVEDEIAQFRRDQELARAVRDGWSEAEIERLKYVQGLEEEARLYERALEDQAAAERLRQEQLAEEQRQLEELAREQERYNQLLRDQGHAFEDLSVRALRAQGNADAADVFRQVFEQRRELEDAVTKGYSSDFIAELLRVQGLERARAEEDRQLRQQQEYDRALASGLSPTTVADTSPSVNLAVGVSEGTATALRGLGQAQLVQQTRMVALLESVDRKLGYLASRSGGDYAAFEALLLQSTRNAATAIGATVPVA